MKLLTTSTAALLLAAPMAFAQSDSGEMTTTGQTDDMGTEMADADITDWNNANLIRTRDITGGNVYTTNEADDEGWDPEYMYDTVGADWNQIGEIEDIVLNQSGQVIGIVAEVGGFLDIGDKHVVIEVNDLNLVAVDDATYAYVTRLNEEDLEAMQDVDEAFWN
jgi:hypothetical protein